MLNLLVSKINNIKVMQVEDSKLSVQNKKADSSKPAKSGKNPFQAEGGANNTVDLGAGKKTHTIKIFAFNSNDTSRLFDVLYNERFCDITDKFFGKIKVYIDSVEITNSDKHVGRTIIAITATVQDDVKLPVRNATALMQNAVDDLEIEIENDALDIASDVDAIDTLQDDLTNLEYFIDEILDVISNALQAILELQYMPLDFFNKIREKVNRLKRISNTLKLIKEIPEDFTKLLLDMTEVQTGKIVDLFETTINGTKIESIDTDLSAYSQIDSKSILKKVKANNLMNLVVATSEMKQALSKDYASQDVFDAQIERCIERLNNTKLEHEKIVELQQILKYYSNLKKLKKVVDLEVKKETPLVAIVFELYGDLEFYDDIRALNNFADNDAIIGTIKVYDNESIS